MLGRLQLRGLLLGRLLLRLGNRATVRVEARRSRRRGRRRRSAAAAHPKNLGFRRRRRRRSRLSAVLGTAGVLPRCRHELMPWLRLHGRLLRGARRGTWLLLRWLLLRGELGLLVLLLLPREELGCSRGAAGRAGRRYPYEALLVRLRKRERFGIANRATVWIKRTQNERHRS